MNRYILGLNTYHPDSSACLFKNNDLLCAIEEERFTRVKHFSGFPINAIKNCLKFANIKIDEVEAITVNKNTYSNILFKGLYFLKNSSKKKNFSKINKSVNFNTKLNNDFKKYFQLDIKKKIYNVDHHLCHLFNSFYTSNFDESYLLSIDGFGDFASINLGYFDGKIFKILKKTLFPHSLGIFYQAITQLLGFKSYGEEYKVMGMSAYGKNYMSIFDDLIQYDKKNFININLEYFSFLDKDILKTDDYGNPNIPNLFSNQLERKLIPQRQQNEKISDIHFDIAYSLQKRYETILIDIVKEIKKFNLSNNICISGGCANNSLANGKILKQFKNLSFSYASGDNGGAIGSSLYYLQKKNINISRRCISSPYQGIIHNDDDIISIIDKKKYTLNEFENDNDLIDFVTDHLKANKVIALYRGRSEFGPRALGNRSILANPSKSNIREILNTKIKKREEFRPFAPSILDYKQGEFFENDKKIPYMTEVINAKINTRDKIHGAVHVDGTSRIQTVTKNMNEFYYRLLEMFYEKTKIPVLLNTSFNITEPIVESPFDAYSCFKKSEIDILVINNFIICRNDLLSS